MYVPTFVFEIISHVVLSTCKTKNSLKCPQCSLKVPSSCLGQEDFSVMQVSFHSDLPMSTGNGLDKLSAN